MGIHMDQHMGLNEWARRLLKSCGKPHFSGGYRLENVVVSDHDHIEVQVAVPVFEPCVRREPTGDCYYGYGGPYSLYRYTFRDGRVYTEYVQASPWSSGPVFFLALKDEKGNIVPDSLWNEEEINNA